MMKKLCEHEEGLHLITHIKDPKWSTNEILIDTNEARHQHLVIRFANESPKKKYGWFYMDGGMVRRHRKQKNGRIEVYVVPLDKREEFEPINICEHNK